MFDSSTAAAVAHRSRETGLAATCRVPGWAAAAWPGQSRQQTRRLGLCESDPYP